MGERTALLGLALPFQAAPELMQLALAISRAFLESSQRLKAGTSMCVAAHLDVAWQCWVWLLKETVGYMWSKGRRGALMASR